MGLVLGDLSYRENVTRAGPCRVSGPALDEHVAFLWGKFAEADDEQPMGMTALEGLTGLYDARFFPTTFRQKRCKSFVDGLESLD